jgi:D-hexose-6-phosphate mutarotase
MSGDLTRTKLPSSIHVTEGAGGLRRISIQNDLTSGEIYFQGAHVTGWRPASTARPVLWMSRKSLFEIGRPIRGGVPVCFPWFGAHPSDPSAPGHGFARLREWTLIRAEEAGDSVLLAFELTGERVSALWPHSFRMEYRIEMGGALRLELDVHNIGRTSFTFEEALHTYIAVHDVRGVTVGGLEHTEYLDKVASLERRQQGDAPVRFTAETDRIYLATRAACVVEDPGGRRRIRIGKGGSDATVVWNPWVEKARAMPDFGDEEWPEMLCVETANVNVHAVTLAPDSSHTMTATIEVEENRD